MPGEEEKPASLASLRLGSRRVPPRSAAVSAEPLRPQLDLLFGQESSVAERAGTRASSPVLVASAPVAERRVWTVRSLVAELRQRVEAGYTDLWVEGELSNCRSAPSGHLYLTLKDGEAQLPVVLFRREALLLRFRPTDGMSVLVRGRLSVYESRGQLQLIADAIEPRGAGALQVAFEQMKRRLTAEGLFEASRKRTLPAFPRCIGVITSPHGAVLRDMVTVVRRRHARLNLLVYPASMQGVHCAPSVVRAIRWFNRNPGSADLIVIARGGGSAEDLAGFNDEALARAIAASDLPVVSAVGHETDFTIADFVADQRAPTPSAAAELVTQALHRIELRLNQLQAAVFRSGRFHLLQARARYNRISADALLGRVRDAANRRAQRVDDLRQRLETASVRRLRGRRERLASVTIRLDRQDPELRLTVGGRRLQSGRGCVQRLASEIIARRRLRLEHAAARLEALSPVAVLARGYALVYASDGTLLRAAKAARPGETIRARLGSGALTATVTETHTP